MNLGPVFWTCTAVSANTPNELKKVHSLKGNPLKYVVAGAYQCKLSMHRTITIMGNVVRVNIKIQWWKWLQLLVKIPQHCKLSMRSQRQFQSTKLLVYVALSQFTLNESRHKNKNFPWCLWYFSLIFSLSKASNFIWYESTLTHLCPQNEYSFLYHW